MKNVANLLVMSFLLTIVDCSEPLANYEGFDRSESPKTSSSESEVENQKISVQKLKIIKEGSLAFECTSLEETRDLINEAVKKTRAYISNENITTFPERAEQSLEIRVPAENLDTLVSEISQGVTQFENRKGERGDTCKIEHDVKFCNKQGLFFLGAIFSTRLFLHFSLLFFLRLIGFFLRE